MRFEIPVAVIHSFHQLLLLAHPELSNDLYFQKIQENMAFSELPAR